MNRIKKLPLVIIGLIFLINIAVITIPIMNEEFYQSDSPLLDFLRGIGVDNKERESAKIIPRLINFEYDPSDQSNNNVPTIHSRISQYFVSG